MGYFIAQLLRIPKDSRWLFLLTLLIVTSFTSINSYAETYNLSAGQRPPCSSNQWTVSGTSYTCNWGSITLSSGDRVIANSSVTLSAEAGFSITNSVLGSAANRVNLQAGYGVINATGTTIHGNISATSSAVNLTNTTLSGTLTTGGNVTIEGGNILGLMTSLNGKISSDGATLQGGATAHNGLKITGGTITGSFTAVNEGLEFSNVTMTSGSVHANNTVTISGSNIGSASNPVNITANNSNITLSDNTVVYGNATGPYWSKVYVNTGSVVYGTCIPESRPASACSSAPPTPLPPGNCPTGLISGITGQYFNNSSLSGTPTGTRNDSVINFDWGTSPPGVNGIGYDNFSIRWSGFVRVTQTGQYTFQTNTDDGVRLTLAGRLLIDQWNDHVATDHQSAAVTLVAGNIYPILLEYYENTVHAVMQLRWKTPGSNAFVTIPGGSSPVAAAGLYECPTAAFSYLISHSSTGLTCAPEAVTVTAVNASNTIINPPAGTLVTLTTNPATGLWSGGNTFTFNGAQSSFTKNLRQTTPGTLEVIASSSPTSVGSSLITFTDVGLKIADNFSQWPPAAVANQIAGISGSARLKVLRTDTNTGACVAQVGVGSRPVNLGFSCINPASCIAGQTFRVNGTAVAANNATATVVYSPVNLTFDNAGEAPISINYSDVGQVRLHGQLLLNGGSSEPSLTLSGSSDLFVVKPHSIAVSAVQRADGSANPGGTNAAGVAAQFVAANEPFRVLLEARNGANPAGLTPNFGRELVPQTQHLTLKTKALVYPVGGEVTALTSVATPVAIAPQGTFSYEGVRWNQVGSIVIEPTFDDGNAQTTNDGDYLGAGNIPNLVASGTVGRFYPHHFELKDVQVADTCGNFTYMDQPLALSYRIEAKGSTESNSSAGSGGESNSLNNTLNNYGEAYVNGQSNLPLVTYVAEPADTGIDLGARFNDFGVLKHWAAGSLVVYTPNAIFNRLTAPLVVDGPYANLQLGIKLTDNFDLRAINNLDMNALTTGECTGAGCTAIKLGSALNMRYGRLRLENAYGSASAKLPVNFYTEYWNGFRFVRNIEDSCTSILRSAIEYPAGKIFAQNNLNVALSGGTTSGNYELMDDTQVKFSAGDAGHFFTAPGAGVTGTFNIHVDLSAYPWLRFDWNNTGKIPTDTECTAGAPEAEMPDCRISANIGFGDYRGHDRIIFWREQFQ